MNKKVFLAAAVLLAAPLAACGGDNDDAANNATMTNTVTESDGMGGEVSPTTRTTTKQAKVVESDQSNN